MRRVVEGKRDLSTTAYSGERFLSHFKVHDETPITKDRLTIERHANLFNINFKWHVNWRELSKSCLFRFFLAFQRLHSHSLGIGQVTCHLRVFRGEGREKVKEWLFSVLWPASGKRVEGSSSFYGLASGERGQGKVRETLLLWFFSISFSLKLSVCQGVIFWGMVFWAWSEIGI